MALEQTNPKRSGGNATQEFVPIDTIRDGIVVLRAGKGLRAVLMVSALNFALKSEEEQDALIYQYENFLNSLDFPMQFIMQSRRLNIQPYLDTVTERQKQETNELLKVQIGEYMEFVKTFVEISHVVSKTFYAVIPFHPSVAQQTSGVLKGLGRLIKPSLPQQKIDDEESFAEWKNQLMQRVDAVSLGLRRLDLRTVLLNTEELTELYYGLYNPSEAQRVHPTPDADTAAANAAGGTNVEAS